MRWIAIALLIGCAQQGSLPQDISSTDARFDASSPPDSYTPLADLATKVDPQEKNDMGHEKDLGSLPDLSHPSQPVDMLPAPDLAPPCGYLNQACCSGTCASPMTCDDGTCKYCGGLGQACCSNSSCQPTTCSTGICHPICLVNGASCSSQTDRICVLAYNCGSTSSFCCDDTGQHTDSTSVGHCKLGLQCRNYPSLGARCGPCI